MIRVFPIRLDYKSAACFHRSCGSSTTRSVSVYCLSNSNKHAEASLHFARSTNPNNLADQRIFFSGSQLSNTPSLRRPFLQLGHGHHRDHTGKNGYIVAARPKAVLESYSGASCASEGARIRTSSSDSSKSTSSDSDHQDGSTRGGTGGGVGTATVPADNFVDVDGAFTLDKIYSRFPWRERRKFPINMETLIFNPLVRDLIPVFFTDPRTGVSVVNKQDLIPGAKMAFQAVVSSIFEHRLLREKATRSQDESHFRGHDHHGSQVCQYRNKTERDVDADAGEETRNNSGGACENGTGQNGAVKDTDESRTSKRITSDDSDSDNVAAQDTSTIQRKSILDVPDASDASNASDASGAVMELDEVMEGTLSEFYEYAIQKHALHPEFSTRYALHRINCATVVKERVLAGTLRNKAYLDGIIDENFNLLTYKVAYVTARVWVDIECVGE